MYRIFRTVLVLVAVSALAAAFGCVQAQKTTVQGKLSQAQSLREEVRANPGAEMVKDELDQSERYQEKAEAYMVKSKTSTSVELKGVRDRYTTWANQMADLSLKKVHEAKIKLEGEQQAKAETEDSAPAAVQDTDQKDEKDAKGPPGPLTASQEQVRDDAAKPIVEQPLGAPTQEAPKTASRDEQQGPTGPLKMSEQTEAQASPQFVRPNDPAPDKAQDTAQAGTAGAIASAQAGGQEQSQPAAAPATKAQEEEQPQASQAATAPPEAEPPAQPKVLYARALALYNSGDYNASRRLFLAFLAQHPNHALAVNSQYWIGETYYAEAEYVLALGAFEAVVSQYPDGGKVPDGMVKMGLSEMKLGRLGQGRKALEECLSRYPDSEAAQVARKYLDKMAE